MKLFSLLIATTAIGVGLGMSNDVQAATATRLYFQNASGICQPALPVFDGNIRKRPTAVANEGTSNAFVSCSSQTQAESTTGIGTISLVLYNRTAAPISATCSLVHSFQTGGLIIPKTLSVPANNRVFFDWTAAEVSFTSVRFANWSCNLPPGVDVGYAIFNYSEEIGT